MNVELEQKGRAAREAARVLSRLSAREKNNALERMARAVMDNQQAILLANSKDVAKAKAKGLNPSLVNRLSLDETALAGISRGLKELIDLPDPVGEIIRGWTRPNGLKIEQVRVPLGVIGMIYEARPNVTVDAAGLCLKSGNAVVLRGGSEAIQTNLALAAALKAALAESQLPAGAVQLIENTDRLVVNQLLKCNKYLDVLIPRGGQGLIRLVVENSTVPVLETGTGNCHVFIDRAADLVKGLQIVVNAKTQHPGVCNAMETLLIDREIAEQFLPLVADALTAKGVELRGCAECLSILPEMLPAIEEDWATEYLDLILAVKIVTGIDEALEHIFRYGSKHSEAIVTENYSRARQFLQEVDAAAVYVNASTRFTDGGRFGFGAEIGISTQKLHARGPMGLKELTTTKYLVTGDGQIV